MIAVCDVNEIWRRKPFSALAERVDVLGVMPADWLAIRRRVCPEAEGKLQILSVALPLGWASRTALVGQRLLWRKMEAEARKKGKRIECVIATSPHYATLLRLLPTHVAKIYYASDDYRSYNRWGNMARLEGQIVEIADHSVFVSAALAARAISEYGVDVAKVSVSMNGTEQRFYPTPGERLPLPPPIGSLPRPIVGVVGGINDRLDFELLKACSEIQPLGTLLLVGPLPDPLPNALAKLLENPKCIAVGAQPHDRIHEWFKCLDIGIIPYAMSVFNRYCSPMRLFDHLATGLPLVCTDACDQVHAFHKNLNVCSTPQEFLEMIDKILRSNRAKVQPLNGIGWDSRALSFCKLVDCLSATRENRSEDGII
ncbi:glycosyltransferase [Pontiellaceae bacterium B1224]|nr:glycosyltransferase [Pontiellaceae bacterium B1224]